jgi:DNA-binding transcriptional ArsR family regulator
VEHGEYHPPNCAPAQTMRDATLPSLPLGWVTIAANLPGRALHAGIAIWYAASQSDSTAAHLSNVLCLRFGLDRNAKYRALRALEVAGLVAVKRRRGQSPLVTISHDGGTM